MAVSLDFIAALFSSLSGRYDRLGSMPLKNSVD
jgi:hypothetical protein